MLEAERLDRAAHLFGDPDDLAAAARPDQNDEFLAAEPADRAAVPAARRLHRPGDRGQAGIARLMAVEIVVALEVVDIDQDHAEGLAASLPSLPGDAQFLVDRPAVREPRHRVGGGEPQQVRAALGDPLLLDLGPHGVEEDPVALPVELPVHEKGQQVGREIERADHGGVGRADREQRRQGQEEAGEDQSRGRRSEAEAEIEEQVRDHHEDDPVDDVVGRAEMVRAEARQAEPGRVGTDNACGTLPVDRRQGLSAAELGVEPEDEDHPDAEAGEAGIGQDVGDQQRVGRCEDQVEQARDPDCGAIILSRLRGVAALAEQRAQDLRPPLVPVLGQLGVDQVGNFQLHGSVHVPNHMAAAALTKP